jgi:hypothetical protein
MKTIRLFFAHWSSAKELSPLLWERVIFTWHLTRFRCHYRITTPNVTRIQRAAIATLEDAFQSIYDRNGELLLQGIKEGEEVQSNAEAFFTLSEAMRRVEHGEEVGGDFERPKGRPNILMFPIGGRRG